LRATALLDLLVEDLAHGLCDQLDKDRHGKEGYIFHPMQVSWSVWDNSRGGIRMKEESKNAIREAIAEMRDRGFTIVNNN
jgi:hypothetical protein